MTPPTDRMLIWRMANRTLVSVRQAYQPRRPRGFSAGRLVRLDSRVIDVMVRNSRFRLDFEPRGSGRWRRDRVASRGQAVLEVCDEVVDVFEPNGDAHEALTDPGRGERRVIELAMGC